MRTERSTKMVPVMPDAALSRGMNRREFLRVGGASLASAVLLANAGNIVLARTGPSLKTQFESAAAEYDVPVQLLLAMGYVNTLWEMPPPTASDYEEGAIEGRGAYGTMQLIQNPFTNTLGRAATLTGLSEELLKSKRAANVRGGAALLGDVAGKPRPSDINSWYEAVAEYGGPLYANEVFQTLKSGASATISTGERLQLLPQESVVVPQLYTAQSTANYARAVWRPAHYSNYTNASRGAAKINKIVVHVAQGSYSGTISWFQNPAANVSSHYVVGRKGQVAQCVHNADIAWHAGNWTYNQKSMGIEHAGYVSNPNSFTRAMYRSSARLSAYLCKRYGIPIDRQHIMGHNQVPGATHTDPGRYWDWRKYMRLIRSFAS
jgi:N-acetylmuramoyl-L-alanine amidase